MFTAEQIAQMVAAGMSPAQIAALGATTAPAAAAPAPLSFHPGGSDPLLAGIRSAPPPTSYGMSFVDDGGKYDGDYRVRIKEVSFDNTDKGKVLRTTMTVLASNQETVPVGSEREYALFTWNKPALAETQGWLQQLSDAKGNVGPFTDAFYRECTGEANVCAGLEFDLSVFTKPQKRNPSKSFTHYRFSAPSGAPSMIATPPSIPGGAAYSTAAAPAVPPKPANWPDTLPWPPVMPAA